MRRLLSHAPIVLGESGSSRALARASILFTKVYCSGQPGASPATPPHAEEEAAGHGGGGGDAAADAAHIAASSPIPSAAQPAGDSAAGKVSRSQAARRSLIADLLAFSNQCGSSLRPLQYTSLPSADGQTRIATDAGEGTASAAADAPPTPSSTAFPSEKEATQFINGLVRLLQREVRLERLVQMGTPKSRAVHALLRRRHVSLTTSQRNRVLDTALALVDHRKVSIVVASRLLQTSWPSAFTSIASGRPQHHRLLQHAVRDWAGEAVRQKQLDARTARLLLENASVALRRHVPLVGSLATLALEDLPHVDNPDAVISFMWAVADARTHAPDTFWQHTFQRMRELNRSAKGSMSAALFADSAPSEEKGVAAGSAATTPSDAEKKMTSKSQQEQKRAVSPRRRSAESAPGHVFSGLTTRQLYRTLRVLKKERWGKDISGIYDFADQALKNIIFEIGAAAFPSPSLGKPLTRSGVRRRVTRVADLSPAELMLLLTICREIGIPFNTSVRQLADHLLCPLVPHLSSDHLLQCIQMMRRTHSQSPLLLQTVLDTVAQRGPTAAYALPFLKSLLRSLAKDPEMLPHLKLESFYAFMFTTCEVQKKKVRGAEVASVVELLHQLSRQYANTSSIGTKLRSTVDELCFQLHRLVEMGAMPPSLCEKPLEATILLGMRGKDDYPNVRKLYEARNHVVEQQRLHAARLLELDDPKGVSEDLVTHPRVARAAVHVYNQLIYLYERAIVVRSPLTNSDKQRLVDAVESVGLYNVFVGAELFRQGHLIRSGTAAPLTASKSKRGEIPPALPPWVEQTAGQILEARMRRAALSSESSDENVLRLCGQTEFSAEKVRQLIVLIKTSPLTVARKQRSLWMAVKELSVRFGDEEGKKTATAAVESALY